MRYDTHAFRIAHGVPIFVTLSPDDEHNLLMIRSSRAHANDPAIIVQGAEMFKYMGKTDEPGLHEEFGVVSLEEL